MKQLAASLSMQRGILYEFGPEYEEYCAKKAAGILGVTHIKPLSEMFSEDQLEAIPIDNKVGENYFGQMTNQLRAKGGTAFKAISERLVLKSNADIAFADGAERMLRDKELKKKQKELCRLKQSGQRLSMMSSGQKLQFLIVNQTFLRESKQKTRQWLFVQKMGNV